MAKGQSRSNKEVRKPKKVKEPAAAAVTAVLSKGVLGATQKPKK